MANLSEIVKVRMTRAQLARLQLAAEAVDRTLSDVLRHAAILVADDILDESRQVQQEDGDDDAR